MLITAIALSAAVFAVVYAGAIRQFRKPAAPVTAIDQEA
jgi:hypothetical protein